MPRLGFTATRTIAGRKHAPVKHIAGLKHLHDGAVLVLRRFRAVHRLVQMRIERLPGRIDALDAQLA